MNRWCQAILLFTVAALWSVPALGAETEEAKKNAPTKEQVKQFQRALETLATSTRPQDLAFAGTILKRGYPESRDMLVRASKRGSKRVRAQVIRLFGELGDPEKNVDVVASALKDPVNSVRMAAVMAMRRLGKEGFDALGKFVRKEPEHNIRKMAVKTFQEWGDPEAVPLLVDLLESERDSGVRKFIVRALHFLTREKLGDDLAAWREYLEKQRLDKERKEIIDHARSLKE